MSDAAREHFRSLCRSLAVTFALAFLVCSSSASAAAAPPWGACGRSTPEDKVVRQFSGGITLRCGGPLGEVPRYGYRHIIARHQLDFENMAWATGTFQNWRDVADFAIDTVTADPDVSVPAGGNQLCLSRVVFLNNIDAATRNVNSAHPRERQC